MKELTESYKAAVIEGIPEANLALFCPGLHGLGSTLIDRSLNATHGTIVGATKTRLSRDLYALSLNGTTDYVTFGNILSFAGVLPFTICIWAVFNNPADEPMLMMKGTATNHWWLSIGTNRKASFRRTGGGVLVGVDAATAITAGVWCFYAGVYDGTKSYLYLNGILNKTGGADTNSIAANTNPLRLGFRSDSTTVCRLNGMIKMPQIFSRALLAAEILRLYNRQRQLLGV